MATLQQDTHATQIHGQTFHELVDCKLVAGQDYERRGPADYTYNGQPQSMIVVAGYLYRVLDASLDD